MNKRLAAIDFGLKRIGIALSDPTNFLASPLTTVEGGKNAIPNIIRVLSAYPLEKILVGLPLLMNGKDSDMTTLVRTFAQNLEAAIHIPTLLIDERLTSAQADKFLKEQSFNRKQRSSKIDTAAATLLLQHYLDSQR